MKPLIQSLKNFVFKPKEIRIEIQQVKSTEITLAQWQKTPNLVTAAMKVHADPGFKMMLDCLRSEHPCGITFPAVATQPTDRMALQAKIEGYELALNRLAAMAVPYKISKPLEATFEPTETK